MQEFFNGGGRCFIGGIPLVGLHHGYDGVKVLHDGLHIVLDCGIRILFANALNCVHFLNHHVHLV